MYGVLLKGEECQVVNKHSESLFILSKYTNISGQAGAVRLGISRAIECFSPELRPLLKKGINCNFKALNN